MNMGSVFKVVGDALDLSPDLLEPKSKDQQSNGCLILSLSLELVPVFPDCPASDRINFVILTNTTPWASTHSRRQCHHLPT